MNVLIPALFTAVVPALVLHDALDDWNLPDYLFVGLGIAIFVTMFLFLTVQETTDKKAK